MLKKWKLNRLTKHYRAYEVELAGIQSQLKGIEASVKLTSTVSIYQKDQLERLSKEAGELRQRMEHIQYDIDNLRGMKR
jgi:prefoldin subunit 5